MRFMNRKFQAGVVAVGGVVASAAAMAAGDPVVAAVTAAAGTVQQQGTDIASAVAPVVIAVAGLGIAIKLGKRFINKV